VDDDFSIAKKSARLFVLADFFVFTKWLSISLKYEEMKPEDQ